jgi:Protein of unknown function (DUF3551)
VRWTAIIPTEVNIMMRIALSTAALACVLLFDIPTGHAQTTGDGPWCAVVELGPGEVQWDCEYDSVQECTPHVLAGNRGFCNLNPYWRGAPSDVKHRGRQG